MDTNIIVLVLLDEGMLEELRGRGTFLRGLLEAVLDEGTELGAEPLAHQGWRWRLHYEVQQLKERHWLPYSLC